MPFGKWQDFDACVTDFKSQGKDEESARKICGALQARLGKESFSWTGDIQLGEKQNLIRGKAIHPVKTMHPEEWPNVRVYLEDELQKAAHTLADQPLLLDHLNPLNGKILAAQYEDGAVEYVAELDDPQVLGWIRDGTIKHCSVEYDWSSLDKVNGIAPRGIQFMGLALLKDFLPGDPQSSVEVWEALIKRLKEAKRMGFSKEFLESLTSWFENREAEYPWDQCMSDMKAQGYDDDSAANICEAIKHKTVSHALDMKLAANIEEAVNLVAEKVSKDALVSYLVSVVLDQCNRLRELAAERKTLEDKAKTLEAEKTDLAKRLGEGVIEPQKRQEDLRHTVLKELRGAVFERVPQGWAYGPWEQNRRIKDLIKRLEDGEVGQTDG